LNHTHFIFPDALVSSLLKRLTGLPYVVTAHGSDVPGFNPNRFRFAHRLLKPIWRNVVRKAEEVICPSRSLAQLVERHCPGRSVTVIPNGIDVNQFSPRPKRRNQVLVVSRLFERTGVHYWLQALGDLRHSLVVHVVGAAPYLGELQRFASQLYADVQFHGWLDNDSEQLRELFEASSIFVFPSEPENFPVVLLEAMTAGLAIITTEGTGCAEVVGDAALLVPPRDAPAIRTALQALLEDSGLCRTLGEAARARVESKFSWSVIARQLSS